MTSRKRGKTLGQEARARLMETYHKRGDSAGNIWLHYSSKANADVVLPSDIQFGHYLLLESDTNVVAVDYAPQKRVASIGGDAIGTIVDAEVTLRNDKVQWHEAKSSKSLVKGDDARALLQILTQQKAAGVANVEHVVMTEQVIFANPVRIRNWFNVIPWIAQARFTPVRTQAIEVAAFLGAKRRVSFAQVLALGAPADRGLFGAALLKGVQNGSFQSDLDERPFSAQSSFYLQESAT